jgi:hypothetical protein
MCPSSAMVHWQSCSRLLLVGYSCVYCLMLFEPGNLQMTGPLLP